MFYFPTHWGQLRVQGGAWDWKKKSLHLLCSRRILTAMKDNSSGSHPGLVWSGSPEHELSSLHQRSRRKQQKQGLISQMETLRPRRSKWPMAGQCQDWACAPGMTCYLNPREFSAVWDITEKKGCNTRTDDIGAHPPVPQEQDSEAEKYLGRQWIIIMLIS